MKIVTLFNPEDKVHVIDWVDEHDSDGATGRYAYIGEFMITEASVGDDPNKEDALGVCYEAYFTCDGMPSKIYAKGLHERNCFRNKDIALDEVDRLNAI